MSLRDQHELEVTQKKLRLLEERFAVLKLQPVDNPRVRELTLRSLKRMINQMKEEIARYKAGSSSRRAEPLPRSTVAG